MSLVKITLYSVYGRGTLFCRGLSPVRAMFMSVFEKSFACSYQSLVRNTGAQKWKILKYFQKIKVISFFFIYLFILF